VTGHIRTVIEDDPRLGPWFCPLPDGTIRMDVTAKALFMIPQEQVQRWEQIQLLWEQAQEEMRVHLRQRERAMVMLVGRTAGPDAADRVEKQLRRRRRT